MAKYDFATVSAGYDDWYASNVANRNAEELAYFVPYLNYNAQLATNQANLDAVNRTNMANMMAVQSTNSANMSMNQANINFQREENEIARAREDNAVQRRADDLTRAGLSKTLAAGSAASANAMQAPANKFEMKAPSFQAPSFQAAQFNLDVAAMKNAFNNIKNDDIRVGLEQDQNEMAHAKLKLEQAGLSLDIVRTMSDVEAQRFENLHTQALTTLAETQNEDLAKRLSIEITEAAYRSSLYAAQVAQAGVDLQFSQENLRLLGVQITNAVLEGENISASTREKIAVAVVQELTASYMNQNDGKPVSVTEGEKDREAQAKIVADEIASREAISYEERLMKKQQFLDDLKFQKGENRKDRITSVIRTIAGAAVAGFAGYAMRGGAKGTKQKFKD